MCFPQLPDLWSWRCVLHAENRLRQSKLDCRSFLHPETTGETVEKPLWGKRFSVLPLQGREFIAVPIPGRSGK